MDRFSYIYTINKLEQYITEKNYDFLKETGAIKNYRYMKDISMRYMNDQNETPGVRKSNLSIING